MTIERGRGYRPSQRPPLTTSLRPVAPLKGAPAKGGRQSYWTASRAPRYSITFALPLLVLYEALAALLARPDGGGVRNGADVVLRSLALAAGGRYGPLVLGAAIIGLCLWLIVRDARRFGWRLRPSVFARMLGESAVLAVLVGIVVGVATAQLLRLVPALASPTPLDRAGWATRLML